MSSGWEFWASEWVTRFVSALPAGDRRKLLQVFAKLASNPIVQPSDLPRVDTKGRRHWLRFSDGYAVIFWIDHAEKELRVIDVGFD